MSGARFALRDDVFVRNPSNYAVGAISITGEVVEQITRAGEGWQYGIYAEICYPSRENVKMRVHIREEDMGHRPGTRASELLLGNGRTTERFNEIVRTWGYP